MAYLAFLLASVRASAVAEAGLFKAAIGFVAALLLALFAAGFFAIAGDMAAD